MVTGTVDFVCADGREVYRTNTADSPTVVQLGAADAVTALQAASLVSRDVNGIDLNMGCPMHFSTQGGMGSALLTKPEIATDVSITTPITNDL